MTAPTPPNQPSTPNPLPGFSPPLGQPPQPSQPSPATTPPPPGQQSSSNYPPIPQAPGQPPSQPTPSYPPSAYEPAAPSQPPPPSYPPSAYEPAAPSQPPPPNYPPTQPVSSSPYHVPVQKKSGSRQWKIGLVLLVAGIALGLLLGFIGINRVPSLDDLPQATGDRQPVELTAGGWTVFGENGRGAPTIVGPNGEMVRTRSSTSSSNYTVNGRSGSSIGEVEIETAGTYLVTSPTGQTTVFGQGLIGDLFRSVVLIFAAFIAGGLLALAGVVLIAISLVRR